MKRGEYYRHKWNKYVVKVTDIGRKQIHLNIVSSGVEEVIATENFEANYTPCVSIHQWRTTIDEMFSFADKIVALGNTIRMKCDESVIDFSMSDENLTLCFTDDIKEAVEADTNTMRFLLEDADTVLEMFADLFVE